MKASEVLAKVSLTDSSLSELTSAYNACVEVMKGKTKLKAVKRIRTRADATKRFGDLKLDVEIFELYGEVYCPHCGVHLENGVIAHGDEDGEGGFIENHSYQYSCMKCMGEFGPELGAKAEPSEARSAGIAKSWDDAEVAAKRKQRHGVEVTVDGVKTSYGSVRKAYIALGIPLNGHIAFRMLLKEKGRVKENGRSWKVVPLQPKEKKAPAKKKAAAKKTPAKKKAAAKK